MINIMVNNKKITLNNKNYLNMGGQGIIYLKNNIIYKIYHDVKKLIPEQKIVELSVLRELKNVIVPTKSIFDYKTRQRIGFIMRYVQDTEYLCKLFVNNFKNNNNITHQMIVDIVKKMQETLIEIHNKGVQVGDYNEMNFLVDSIFKIPYHIDTDSYQTKSYKCNAIMESVRDRTLPLGTFNELSDWFSWAIVTFQMYTGIHPYKGKHPNFKINDFDGRMKNGITVFNKDVTVPKFVNFSVIPKSHLEWYKTIFINGDRSTPPFSDGLGAVSVVKKIYVDSKSKVFAELVYKYDNRILDVVYKNGMYYVLTKDGVYYNNNLKVSFNGNTNNGNIMFTPSNDLIIAIRVKDGLSLYDENKKLIVILTVTKKNYTIFNDSVYVINDAGVTQYSVEKIGKIKCIPNIMSTLNYNSAKIYDGVVMQDIFGKYKAIIPYAYNMCKSVKIKELDGYKILDAKRIDKWLFVIYIDKGKINCISIMMDNAYTKYQYKIDKDVDFKNINAMVKDTGMIVFNKEDNDLELFYDFDRGSKLLENTPVYNDLLLFNGQGTCFINHNEIYILKTK